ncbi:MAG TPA: thioredoxin [Clostridiales bacterium]|nr:thioredoxin [Clostridiales bacterium]
MAIEITKENFEEEVIKSDIPVLVDFWAAWCGPCRMIAPTIEELADELDGVVKVGKVDVDAQPELAYQFNVMSIPTLIVFKNGKVANQNVGLISKADIKKMLGIE